MATRFGNEAKATQHKLYKRDTQRGMVVGDELPRNEGIPDKQEATATRSATRLARELPNNGIPNSTKENFCDEDL